MTGHLLGAAGGVEAVFTVLALRDQVVPPTINLRQRRTPTATSTTCRTPPGRWRSAARLSNSFGFGGTNATLVFRTM